MVGLLSWGRGRWRQVGQTLASEIMADRTLCTGGTIKELDEEGIW